MCADGCIRRIVTFRRRRCRREEVGGLGLAEANLVSLGGEEGRERESNEANVKRYQRGMSRTVDSLKQSGSLIQRNSRGRLMYETGRQSGLGEGGRGPRVEGGAVRAWGVNRTGCYITDF